MDFTWGRKIAHGLLVDEPCGESWWNSTLACMYVAEGGLNKARGLVVYRVLTRDTKKKAQKLFLSSDEAPRLRLRRVLTNDDDNNNNNKERFGGVIGRRLGGTKTGLGRISDSDQEFCPWRR